MKTAGKEFAFYLNDKEMPVGGDLDWSRMYKMNGVCQRTVVGEGACSLPTKRENTFGPDAEYPDGFVDTENEESRIVFDFTAKFERGNIFKRIWTRITGKYICKDVAFNRVRVYPAEAQNG